MSAMCNGQTDDFYPAPIGKGVISHTIYQKGKNSPDGDRVQEEVLLDTKGRVISKKISESYASIRRHEKTTYRNDSSFTYECRCSDIDKFAAEFVIRDKAELIKQRGSATADLPDKYVTLKKYNKKGLEIWSSYYSEHGYKLNETRVTRDKKGKVLLEEFYNFDDVLERSVKNFYDKKGRLTESVQYDKHIPELRKSKYIFSETDQVMITEFYENDVLNFRRKQEEIQTETGSEILFSSEREGVWEIDKRIEKNKSGKEVRVDLYEKGKVTWQTISEYDNKGNLITRIRINPAGEQSAKLGYTYDQKNNWVEMYSESYVIVQTGREQKKELRRTEYRREVGYEL